MPVPGPKGCMPESTLKPRTAGMDKIMISTMFTATAFVLDTPNKSIAKEMMFSNTAMTVESAAKDKNKKNSIPQMRPPAIWLNIWGSVIKIREGPEPGSIPKEKQAGMIIMPAINATNVSSMPMLMASPLKERSLDR